MQARDLMQRDVRSCSPTASLADAAELMWIVDVGSIPVTDEEQRPIAMITDRDICMAAMLTGVPLRELDVQTAMSREIVTCIDETPLADVERRMQESQIRRMPVVDSHGRLVGIVTLADLARHAGSGVPGAAVHVAKTLSAISERRWVARPEIATS